MEEKIYILQKAIDEVIDTAKKEKVSYYLMSQLDRVLWIANSIIDDMAQQTNEDTEDMYSAYSPLF